MLVVAGLGIGSVAAEATWRAYRERHPEVAAEGFLVYPTSFDEYRLYEYLPGRQKLDLLPSRITGTLRTNALGMRDREYPAEKPPGSFRILALGDSVTFGVQVPVADTWENQLERALGSRGPPGESFEVLNLGVPGYNTEQSWLRYQRRGAQLGADLVLLQWGSNDLTMSPTVLVSRDRVVYLYWGDGDHPPTPYRLLPGLNAWMLSRSLLYRDLSLSVFVALDRWLVPTLEMDDVRARNLEAILLLRDDVTRRGGRLAVVLFPDVTDLERPVDEADRQDLLRYLGAHGVRAVDLVPAFRGFDAAQVRLAAGDPVHLNSRGYGVAAEAIHHELESWGWLP